MFKKIEINYPDFGLTLEREFTPGINLIEEPNGYGKTTILNTILSLYSKKYVGIKGGALPSGTAKIYTEDKIYLLAKKLWVGLDQEPNDLIRYILPGEFFSLTTPDQRKIMVRLLGIDYDKYMQEYIPDWNEDLEKEIKSRLKENEGKESIILDDITRLKSVVIKFEKNPIVLVDNTQDIERAYALLLRDHNDARMKVLSENNSISSGNLRIRNEISSMKFQQDELRHKYTKISSGVCPTCKQKTSITQEQIDEINAEGKALGEKIKTLESQISNAPVKVVPEPWPERSLLEKEAIVNMKLTVSSQEEKDAVAAYIAAKNELEIKTAQLKKLGELKDKETLATIKATKVQFTRELEEKIKGFGLEIELFKTQANGETVESFIIMKDGQQYSELSGGNKLLVQLRLAKAFAKILGLDFLLLDEAGLISQNNFDIIKEECKDFQVIMARATPFKSEVAVDKPKKKTKA